jgi:formylglycine-generating enzyme required for sulfatase activity
VRGNAYALLDLRLRAAALLGEVGDPRLIDPQTGNSALGAYWCDIAAGPFWFGDDRNQDLRQMTLPYAYRIGRYLVTNAEYRRFVEAGGYRERRWWTEQGWRVNMRAHSRMIGTMSYRISRVSQ